MKSAVTLSPRTRIILALALAGVAIILGVIFIRVSTRAGADTPAKRPAGKQLSGEEQIARGVEAVCAEYNVPAGAIRSRRIKDGNGNGLRTEYRLRVPKDFSAAEFNRTLNQKVEPWGAHVLGTERTRDRTVTLHVIRDDETIVSVILDMNEPTKAGKEHGH
jgi:hypothetical protein